VANIPSIELLESTHQFPGNFIFKAIGPAGGGFAARVVAAAREGLGSDIDPPFTERASGSGNHVSVTIEVYVESAQEVREVYEKVMGVKDLILLL